MRPKTLRVQIKPKIKQVLMIVAILLLLAWFLKFQVIADFVSGIIFPNDPNGSAKIMEIADTSYGILMGILLILLGWLLVASPVIGFVIIIIGVGVLAYTIYNTWFNKNDPK
jgi:hypothetical protein